MAVAPETANHWIKAGWEPNKEIKNYIDQTLETRAKQTYKDNPEKTGIFSGLYAINPAKNEEVPVWITNYVLADVGTGAIMAVPAHDERDFDFAKKYNLPISDAPLISVDEAIKKVGGKKTVRYKLKDWVFSRQRYWGEPIPIIICKACGYVPVPEDQLPVLLPDVESYQPTDTGESPLSQIRSWVEVTCPKCGGAAERETDTMPNWAGSSWYFLRYCDPHNNEEFASAKKLKYWMPVDLYNGGMEHTTLHLLYSRFWHKFLWDIGALPKEIGPEPYRARRSHGLILAEGGEKMSKSKGNVVNPDDIVSQYGADVFRVYEMFMGPFDQPVPWDTNGIEGVRRFLDKAWRLLGDDADPAISPALETVYHQSVKKIGEDIESLSFNTAVSQLMIVTNGFVEAGGVPRAFRDGYLKLIAPFAPHMAEELWSRMGHADSIHRSAWPSYDPAKVVADTFELVIQVNGKVRDRITVPSDISEADAKAHALASESVQRYLEGKEPTKIMYIKGKLVTVVV